MRRILCIWLPHWPLERLVAARPELEQQSVLLYEAHSRGGFKVVAYAPVLRPAQGVTFDASHSAEPDGDLAWPAKAGRRAPASGIVPGMPLAEATALAGWAARGMRDAGARANELPGRRSAGAAGNRPQAEVPPALHLELHDPQADRLALIQLAEWCQKFSPTVGLEENERPQSLLLDVTGLGELFGDEQALAEQVVSDFRNRGWTAAVAIAATIGAAWALAHYARESFRGLVVPAEKTSEALAPLPIAALRLPEPTLALLQELGLHEIGQVLSLPRSTLSSRFGPQLLERLDQALGAAAEVIAAHKLPLELEVQWLLEHATDRREMIDFALQHLITELANALAEQRRGVLRLQCRLDSSASPLSLSVGLYRPSASVRHLLDLVQLQLERVRLRGPVAAVYVAVLETAPLELEQQALFVDDRSREAPRALAALVDRLSSRLGRHAVLRPWLLADAQPEHACQYLPLAGLPSRRRMTKAASARRTILGPCARPLLLAPRPIPLRVVSIAPDGPPAQFCFEGRVQRIARSWGPERIETGWWRSRCVRRDYYRVETTEGHRFWLFRQLQDGQWFLQGEFA